jgi:hypothetical protein
VRPTDPGKYAQTYAGIRLKLSDDLEKGVGFWAFRKPLIAAITVTEENYSRDRIVESFYS